MNRESNGFAATYRTREEAMIEVAVRVASAAKAASFTQAYTYAAVAYSAVAKNWAWAELAQAVQSDGGYKRRES
jgi:hypothetical protein